MRLPRAAVTGALAVSAACAGCAGSTPQGSASGSTVVVLAASSLSRPMTTLASSYEKAHPGVHVQLTTGGSSDLVTQLAGGLHADILATADERTMTTAREKGLVAGEPVHLSTNRLTLVTAPGNPLHLSSLTTASAHDLVVCAAPVPCGAATARLATATHETVRARSEEPNVSAVLAKVTSGQADAGVVYVSDARAAGAAVAAVPLPGSERVVTTQVAARTPDAGPDAGPLLDLLAGPDGRKVLAQAGFGPP